MKKSKLILLTAITATFVACGTDEATPIKGRVIDGYVSGATAYLDLNYNQQKDEGEPSAVSGAGGEYLLELNKNDLECLGYTPTVVMVPVGAVDEDLGVVTEAYSMTLPPTFKANASSSSFDVTPLSSVIWQSVIRAGNNPNDLSCGSVMTNSDLQERWASLINDTIDAAVEHYNISEQRLFADFVANGDIEVSDVAQAIVRGLQKSVIDTMALQQENPTAILARVSYFQTDYRDDGKDQYTDAWYREQVVLTESGSETLLEKVSDDLETRIRTIIYGRTFNAYSGEYKMSESVEFESRHGDHSPYTCDIKEIVTHSVSGVDYELMNMGKKEGVTEYDDCVVMNFDQSLTGRNVFLNFKQDDVQFATQYHYNTDKNFPYLNDWVNLKANAGYIDFGLLEPTLELLSYQFYDVETGSADWWVKTKVYHEAGIEYKITHNQAGKWTRSTTLENGTHKEECGSDGVNWGDVCTE